MMNRAGVLVLAMGALAARDVSASCSEPGCVLVWADEFDGDAVDPTKWSFQLGDGCPGLCGWGNNELQFYREENATVSEGFLTLQAREESFSGYDYTSARLRTLAKGDWTYGRFEMRAKLPTGQGLWPAFWMLSSTPSTYGVWAASGEIDIMESIGSEPDRILGTIHYGGTFPENVSSTSTFDLPPNSASTEFHEYAIEWEPGIIRWYVDGQLYGVRTEWYSTGGPFPAPFDVDFHLLLNLAVGGNLPGSPSASTVFPQELVVDYVRVYQRLEQIAPPLRIFDDMEHGAPFTNGWFVFDSAIAGGGLESNTIDLPPEDGGQASLQAGWGSGGTPGYFGGFGREFTIELTGMDSFSFWINPDPGQDYRLEVNLQDDDNNDGLIRPADDDEFQFSCDVSPSGPCAVSGGGWQKVTIPLSSFLDDGSFLFGGNGQLDASSAAGGNGALLNVVFAIISNTGSDVSFRTDFWHFSGPDLVDTDADAIPDLFDNCTLVANPDQRDTDSDGYGNRCDPDLNNDCQTNFVDLGVLKGVFFGSDPDADLDGDGSVNFVDLGYFKNMFFGPPGPSGLTEVCN